MNERILDVITTSTCRPQLFKTYESFIRNVTFTGKVRFILHIDVLKFNRKYLPAILKFCKLNGLSDYFVNETPRGHAFAVNWLFHRLQSELFFHLEDDWLFERPMHLDTLYDMILSHSEVHQVRFSKEKISRWTNTQIDSCRRSHEEYLMPGEEIVIDNCPLVESKIWSFNPHIARTEIPEKFLPLPTGYNPENYLCKMYWKTYERSGLYIYGRFGDPKYVTDIGRPSGIIRVMTTARMILKDPRLINKEKRISKSLEYRGKPWTT